MCCGRWRRARPMPRWRSRCRSPNRRWRNTRTRFSPSSACPKSRRCIDELPRCWRSYATRTDRADPDRRRRNGLCACAGHPGPYRDGCRVTHLSKVGDARWFAVLFPDGYRQSWAVPGSVTPALQAGIDDVAFVRSLLDFVGDQYGVDSSNLTATGISNGGFFGQVLGCRLADHLAAIAPVAGLM